MKVKGLDPTTSGLSATPETPKDEVYLRAQIAEQTTVWIRRFGGPRVLTAMREWLDYMDRQVATMERHAAHSDGGEGGGTA